MIDIVNSVGLNQPNRRSDVALIQAALNFVRSTSGQRYLIGGIDGQHGPDTQGAIDAFQAEYISDGIPIAPGVMTPGGASVRAMGVALPADRSDLRVLQGQRIVYLGRPRVDAMRSANAIRINATLRPAFRQRVAQMVQTMHTRHGLILSLTRTGARRTFAEQAAIRPPRSYAGPGESNHNYGNAVDIGFEGTVWFRRDGRAVTDAAWLNQLERYEQPAATAMWDARDTIALVAPINLFRLQFERVHLQDFNEVTTSAGRSLAAHLSNVGAWNWQTHHYNQANLDWHYASDLGGTAGVFVEVGTANQIWNGNATVTAVEIRRAGWQRPSTRTAATPPITPADILGVRRALQADFQAADRAWANWNPVR